MSVEAYTIPRFNLQPRPYTIYLGMPMGSEDVKMGAAEAWGMFPSAYEGKDYNIIHAKSRGGITHENLWCDALNRKMPFYANIHTDVVPPWYWLDYLWDLKWKHGADFVGVNISFRDRTKKSTIAIAPRIAATEGRDVVRRLDLDLVERQPEPFSSLDIDPSGESLLCCSTGLWLCDLRKPWCRDLIWASTYERIQADDGTLHPYFCSEDYINILKLGRMGAKVIMSKRMNVGHHGEYKYMSVPARGDNL